MQRPRFTRCHDDCRRLDDRLRDFHCLGGIIASDRRARLVAAGLGHRRRADDYRRALLRRTGGDDAARRRPIRFPARSLRPSDGISFWLGRVSRHPNRNHRGRRRLLLRNFSEFLRRPSRPDNYLIAPIHAWRRLRHQSFHRTTHRRAADFLADLEQHARARARQICPEHFHLRQDGGAARLDRDRPLVRLEIATARRFLLIGGIRRRTAGTRKSRSLVSLSSARSRSSFLLGKAMVGPLFAQTAWNNVTFTGSEVRDPGRNLPRAC